MTTLPDALVDVEAVLSKLPFGICVMDAEERLVWANETLLGQLDLRSNEILKCDFDGLPIDPCKESIKGIYVPTQHPKSRLRIVVLALDDQTKLAVFSDVTDLTSTASGYVELLRELSRTDSSTGLLTPNSVYRELLEQIARCRRYGNRLAVMRVCIEGVEKATADLGKQEQILQEIAIKLADNVRAIDAAGQLSKDEFVLVLPETDIDGAERSAKKLMELLQEEHPLEFRFGIAEWRASDDAKTLLERAK
ncbi:MAG: diguanylate cyclase [Gammaproteobacteria bacterium]|nr:diguanylate cyclase [Gammaproteobacteria bacterium]